MNYGMCRINKGARLKPAEICPNLYFFTSTIFHTLFFFFGKFQLCSFYTSLKRSSRVQVVTAEQDILSGHIHTFSLGHSHTFSSGHIHTFSPGHIHTFSLGHIHVHVFSLHSLQQHSNGIIPFQFCKFEGECCATITVFRNSKHFASSSSRPHNGLEIFG